MNDKEHRFLKKVNKEIEKYQGKLSGWKDEFYVLHKKLIEEKISIKEEKRLMELDDLLEKSIDSRSSIPGLIKEKQEKEFAFLVEETESILERIKLSL